MRRAAIVPREMPHGPRRYTGRSLQQDNMYFTQSAKCTPALWSRWGCVERVLSRHGSQDIRTGLVLGAGRARIGVRGVPAPETSLR